MTIKTLLLVVTICSSFLSCVTLAEASLIVTLTHDGAGGVIASVSGSGTMSTSSLPATEPTNRLLVDDLGPGDPFNSNLNFSFFALTTPLSFAPGINITQIVPDDDAPSADDFFLPLSSSLSPTPVAFNASGSSFVPGLAFADLTVGTYSNPTYPVSVELGGFTLVISDTAAIPEPTPFFVWSLLGMTVIGAGRRRRP